MRLLLSVSAITAILSLITCTKKEILEIQAEPQFALEDSVFYIKSTRQLDLNEFAVEFYINHEKLGTISSGIVAKNISDPSDRSYTQLNNQSNNSTGYQVLRHLRGGTFYHVRLFAVKDKDTVYSAGREIQTQRLMITAQNGALKFHRPTAQAVIITNLPDSNKGLHSRIFIGNTECSVQSEEGKWLRFSIPENIPAGYTSITLKRKELEARYDSVLMYFGKWKSLEEYPVEASPDATRPNHFVEYGVFQKGSKGYLFGGTFFDAIDFNLGISNPDYFLEYDYPSNSWNKISYSTPTYFRTPKVHTVNDEAYIVGGYLDTTRTNGSYLPLKNVYKFDLANRRWIKKRALPWELRAKSVSFAANGKIYIGLGESGKFQGAAFISLGLNELWEYDPGTDTWARKADFPGEPRVHAGAFVIDNKAYVIGGSILVNGSDASKHCSEIWEYNLTTNTWRQVLYRGESLDPFIAPVTFTHEGKGYIVGSWTRGLGAISYNYYPARNWRFDPETESFDEIAYPISNVHGGAIYRSGKKLVFTGKELQGVFETMSEQVTELTLE